MFRLVKFLIIYCIAIKELNNARKTTKLVIGALLPDSANNKIIDDFKREVSRQNSSYFKYGLEFSSEAEIIDLYPINVANQIYKIVKGKGQNMIGIIIAHPRENPSVQPLLASLSCAFYLIPIISTSARSSALSNKYSHPSFARTVPPLDFQTKAWLALIKRFAWKQINLLYSNDIDGTKAFSTLQKATKSNDFSISYHNPVGLNQGDHHDREYCREMIMPIVNGFTRPIFLFVDLEYAQLIFDVAETLNLTGREWTWVISEQLLAARNVPIGAIAVQLDISSMSHHISDAISVFSRAMMKLSKINPRILKLFQPPTRLRRKFIPTFARHKFRRKKLVYRKDVAKMIYTNIINTEIFQGKSGCIKFDRQGNRLYSNYKIINVAANQNGLSPSSYSDSTNEKSFASTESSQQQNRLERIFNTVGHYGVNLIESSGKSLNCLSNQDYKLRIDMSKIVWPGNFQIKSSKLVCVSIENGVEVYSENTGNCKNPQFKQIYSAPKSFKKKNKLRIVTIISKPFVTKSNIDRNNTCKNTAQEIPCSHLDPITNKKSYYCCRGLCIDVLRLLANRTGIQKTYTPFTFSLHLVGDGKIGHPVRHPKTGEKQWNGIMGELLNGQADMAIAPITITPERAKRIEFSKPFNYHGLTILIKKKPPQSNLVSFLQPFHHSLWILVIITVNLIAFVLYLFDTFSPFGRFQLYKSKKLGEDESPLTFSSAIWLSWGVLLNSSIGEANPRSFSARVMTMVWAGFTMIVVASYTANLAAFLVLDRPKSLISGIDDSRIRNPINFSVATVKNSQVDLYFKRQLEFASMYRVMEKYDYSSADEAINDVINGKLLAFIWDSPRLLYEASLHCELVTAGEIFARQGYGIAMNKNDPWISEFSESILFFHEKGKIEKLDTRWIYRPSPKKCTNQKSFPSTLGLQNMAGVFILASAGMLSSISIIFLEILYRKKMNKLQSKIKLMQKTVHQWKSFIEKKRIQREQEKRNQISEHQPYQLYYNLHQLYDEQSSQFDWKNEHEECLNEYYEEISGQPGQFEASMSWPPPVISNNTLKHDDLQAETFNKTDKIYTTENFIFHKELTNSDESVRNLSPHAETEESKLFQSVFV